MAAFDRGVPHVWLHNGKGVKTISLDYRNHHYKKKNISLNDSGEYICRNNEGIAVEQYIVTVTGMNSHYYYVCTCLYI